MISHVELESEPTRDTDNAGKERESEEGRIDQEEGNISSDRPEDPSPENIPRIVDTTDDSCCGGNQSEKDREPYSPSFPIGIPEPDQCGHSEQCMPRGK